MTVALNLWIRVNTPAQVESLLYSLEQAVGGIGLSMNTKKNRAVTFILIIKPLKSMDLFRYLGSNISSTVRKSVDWYWQTVGQVES